MLSTGSLDSMTIWELFMHSELVIEHVYHTRMDDLGVRFFERRASQLRTGGWNHSSLLRLHNIVLDRCRDY